MARVNIPTNKNFAVQIFEGNGAVKYVTSITEGHAIECRDNCEAAYFTAQAALDICRGLAYMGVKAVPVMRVSWVLLANEEWEAREWHEVL